MKKFTLVMLLLLAASVSFSQVREQYALAVKKLVFGPSGLISQGPELQTGAEDSSSAAFSYSLKSIVTFEGTYYQTFYSNKLNGSNEKVFLRKSTDGVNWSPAVRVGDAPADKSEYHSNTYVWKKAGITYAGVVYSDWRTANPQIKFALSTNGGNSFMPPVQVSSHNDNFNIFLGGIAGKGDTIMVNWVRQYSGDRCDQTWFSRSVNGGVTWSPMAEAFAGNHYSFVTDITMDPAGNAWVITADDQFFRVNPVIRFTSNLGSVWETRTQIVDMPSGNTNTNNQMRFLNGKLYCIWTHTGTYADSVNFSVSSNGGNSWRTKKVSDTDTITLVGSTFPTIHPSFSISDGGTIYAVWTDSREKHAPLLDSSRLNIYLSRSTNDGLTWSPSIKINGPSNYSRVLNAYPTVTIRSNGSTDSVLVAWNKYRNVLGPLTVTQISTITPSGFALEQNYPNPFNPVTNINFSIPKSGNVTLKIFDAAGREVGEPVNRLMNAGTYSVSLNAAELGSGVYFYRLEAGEFAETKKMILVK